MNKVLLFISALLVLNGIARMNVPGHTTGYIHTGPVKAKPYFIGRPYKDTVISGWVVRIRPGTTGESIWFSYGAGQTGNGTLGNDTVFIPQFGPEWDIISNGWDQTVTLGNGVHIPTIVSIVQPGSGGFTPASQLKPVIDGVLASRFAPSKGRNAMSWAGPSAGGWLGMMFNATTFSSTSDTSFFNYFNVVVDMQGVISNDASGATIGYPQRFGHRAAVSARFGRPFHYLGIEGTFDESRDTWGRRDNMLDSVPGGDYHSIWTVVGGGAHCCWNTYTDHTMSNFTASNTADFLTLHDGFTSNFIAGGQNLWQYMLRGGDTTNGGPAAPTVIAGNYSVTQANAFDLILQPTVTGSNLKYSWAFSGYYTANDKVTKITTTQNGEPRILAVKQPFIKNAQIIQMSLYPGDSIQTYKVGIKVTDTVTGLFAIDSAVITYRYWNRYPAQNVDGSKAFHLCTTTDSLNPLLACSVFYQDVVITGANSDPVKDAAGVSHFTSFFAFPTFPDTFHIAQKGRASRVYVQTNGNPYTSIKFACDTLGGTGWQPLGIADTLKAHKIYFIAYGPGRLSATNTIYFANIRNAIFTGRYDPVMGIGDPAYPGHANGYAYTDTLYKIGTDNCYMSTAGHGLQIDGKDTYNFEVEYYSSIRGNFDGIDAKVESNSIINGSTRLLFWDYLSIHDCFVNGTHGEAYYIGSANTPAVQLRHIRIYNNRAVYPGNKLLKTLDLYADNWVYNNCGFNGSINFPSPFEPDVSVGEEMSFSQGGNKIFNNLIYGFGNQGLNITTAQVGTVSGIDTVMNNAYMGSWGPIGAFVGQEDSAFQITFLNNFFGLHGPFLFGRVYASGSHAINTPDQLLALPAGNLTSGATRSTYTMTNNTYDSTKVTLNAGDANFVLSGNTRLPLLNVPAFTNTGFTFLFYQMVDTVYRMWGDEFYQDASVKQGQPYLYNLGEGVKWFDKFYISKINNNGNFPTGITDANWTLVLFSNGGTTPPNDITLPVTDLYAIKNIGLKDKSGIAVNNNLLNFSIPTKIK